MSNAFRIIGRLVWSSWRRDPVGHLHSPADQRNGRQSALPQRCRWRDAVTSAASIEGLLPRLSAPSSRLPLGDRRVDRMRIYGHLSVRSATRRPASQRHVFDDLRWSGRCRRRPSAASETAVERKNAGRVEWAEHAWVGFFLI